MIGKVIEGHYKGASVNKLPDKNVLFIQTEDGTKIALSSFFFILFQSLRFLQRNHQGQNHTLSACCPSYADRP